MSEETRTINPDAREIEIGVKKIRKVTLYPLSISDQMKLTEQLTSVIQQFSEFDRSEITNESAIDFMKNVLRDNLTAILQYVIDEDEQDLPTLDEITNNQLYKIANTIFEVNYEGLIKNFKDLFERAGTMLRDEETPAQ
jgi:maltooligosyltrehalose synthase